MIFRALECTVYGREGYTPMTVWFQSELTPVTGLDPAAKVRHLLAVAWDVVEDNICMGNVDSEIELERNSTLNASVRKAAWFEVGGWGDVPLFDNARHMALLDPWERERLETARQVAAGVAREWVEKLHEQKNSGSEGAWQQATSEKLESWIEDLAAFASAH